MTSDAAAMLVIATVLGAPDATPEETAQTVFDLVAAVTDLRTKVYPALVDRCLAARNVHLP